MDTLIQLQKHWRPKHWKHLIYCFKYCTAYFDDHFEHEIIGDNILIDGVILSQEKVLTILSDYYEDSTNDYYSSLGDFVYLCYTDLAEKNVNILAYIDRDIV